MIGRADVHAVDGGIGQQFVQGCVRTVKSDGTRRFAATFWRTAEDSCDHDSKSAQCFHVCAPDKPDSDNCCSQFLHVGHSYPFLKGETS
jgi:hypothetical protein